MGSALGRRTASPLWTGAGYKRQSQRPRSSRTKWIAARRDTALAAVGRKGGLQTALKFEFSLLHQAVKCELRRSLFALHANESDRSMERSRDRGRGFGYASHIE